VIQFPSADEKKEPRAATGFVQGLQRCSPPLWYASAGAVGYINQWQAFEESQPALSVTGGSAERLAILRKRALSAVKNPALEKELG
jgi:hypothetical protein